MEVSIRPPAILIVTFDDGRVNEIDLADQLWGTMFEPLKDADCFRQVRVNHELGTVEWPNGLDLAPSRKGHCWRILLIMMSVWIACDKLSQTVDSPASLVVGTARKSSSI